jgi:hypothetical protein
MRDMLAGSVPRVEELVGTDVKLAGAVIAIVLASVTMSVLLSVWRITVSAQRLLGTGSSTAIGKARRFLLLAQTVVTVALLSLTLVMLLTVHHLKAAPLGFEIDSLYVAQTRLLGGKYAGRANPQIKAFRRSVVERLRSSPAFQSVTTSSAVPFTGTDWVWTVAVPESGRVAANGRTVAPFFFQQLGIQLRAGRLFDSSDIGEPVTVVSQQLADRLSSTQDVVGRTLLIEQPYRIVGIVGDTRFARPSEPPTPAVYVPVEQRESENICFIVKPRAGFSPEQMDREIWQAVAAADPVQPVSPVVSLGLLFSRATSDRRFVALVSACFAMTALALMLISATGLVAHQIEARTKEIAIRSALGADAPRLRWWLARTEMAFLLAGVCGGLWLSYVALSALGPLAVVGHSAPLPV